MNRREFLKSALVLCSGILAMHNAFAVEDISNFKTALKEEIRDVIKRHVYEPDNESTHRVIEAEINDWAHIHVMSGEIADFNVECFDENACLHVQAGFKVSEGSEWTIIEGVVKL